MEASNGALRDGKTLFEDIFVITSDTPVCEGKILMLYACDDSLRVGKNYPEKTAFSHETTLKYFKSLNL